MKKFFIFLIFTIIVSNKFNSLYSQNNCNYEEGEIYELKQSGVNIRSSPYMGNNIITKLESPNYVIDFNLEIVDNKVINNFVKVKIIVEMDSTLTKYLMVNGDTGWVNTDLIIFSNYQNIVEIGYAIVNDSIDRENYILQLDSLIDKYNFLKQINSCKYNFTKHAHYYQQRGIAKYYKKNYINSIYDLSQAIVIDPENSERIISYCFRAFIKQDFEDYDGAIEDYSISIQKCNVKNNNSFDCSCEICSQHKGLKAARGEEFCKEDLLTRRALCYFIRYKYQLALNDANTAILLDNNLEYTYFLRGLIKYSLNDKLGSCKDFSKAGELGFAAAYDEIKEKCN